MKDTQHLIPPVVGFCGAIGHGKDHASMVLDDALGFTRHSFAEPLKHVVAYLYDLPKHRLNALNEADRTWREQEHPRLTRQFGRPMSPRVLLQEFGTEGVRNYCDNTWVEYARRTVKAAREHGTRITFSDTRFPNEVAMIKEEGGIVVKVVRTDGQYGGDAVANRHASEAGIPDSDCDFVLVNDGTRAFGEMLVNLIQHGDAPATETVEPGGGGDFLAGVKACDIQDETCESCQ